MAPAVIAVSDMIAYTDYGPFSYDVVFLRGDGRGYSAGIPAMLHDRAKLID
jgi:hypothetical protein